MLLALPYGTPTILSSFKFDDPINQGAPDGNDGNCATHGASASGWLCQHRWPAVVGMVQVRRRAHATVR